VSAPQLAEIGAFSAGFGQIRRGQLIKRPNEHQPMLGRIETSGVPERQRLVIRRALVIGAALLLVSCGTGLEDEQGAAGTGREAVGPSELTIANIQVGADPIAARNENHSALYMRDSCI
jgi:hypothetical protein